MENWKIEQNNWSMSYEHIIIDDLKKLINQ